jgi:tRNA-Thr(GGU) m(6)t(6)A37 methyltransferase TsaA
LYYNTFKGGDILENSFSVKPIAYIYTDFNEKFGVPRQSGIIEKLTGKIVFEPEFRVAEALRELDGFSHIWLIWQFSENVNADFSPTVRPPRLGGNKRVGVFASRSPFRPNSLGLSAVKIERIDYDCEKAPVIYVSGIDMKSGTPIFDIKPYIPLSDSISDASEGFTAGTKDYEAAVECSEELLSVLPDDKRELLIEVLKHDPRPSYKADEQRIYGLSFAGYNVSFEADGEKLIVTEIKKL